MWCHLNKIKLWCNELNTITSSQPLWCTKCLIWHKKYFLRIGFVYFLRNNKELFDTLSFASLFQYIAPWQLLLAVMFQLCALLEGPGFTLSHPVYDWVIFLVQDSDLGSQLPSPHPLRRNLAKGSFIHHLKEPSYKKPCHASWLSSDFLRGQRGLDQDSGCFICRSCHFQSKYFECQYVQLLLLVPEDLSNQWYYLDSLCKTVILLLCNLSAVLHNRLFFVIWKLFYFS